MSSASAGTQDGGEKMEEFKDLDIDSIIEELDKEFVEAENQLDEPEYNGEEVLENDEVSEEAEVSEEEEVVEDTEDNEVVPDLENDDVHKRNEAFRRLREERDQLAASDQFLTDLAKQYGLTKDQLIERFQEDQLKKQAKEQGIPEDQLRKIREMEQRLQQVEEQRNREIFNIKAEALATKYKLNQNQMMDLFKESANLGIDIVRNPNLLEFAYRAVNYDNAVQEGRQKQLETTKKRASTSTGKTGTRGSEITMSDEEAWDKEIDALIKDLKL